MDIDPQRIFDTFAKSGEGFGIKVGPGVLPVIGAIWGAGLIAVAVAVWGLHDNAWFAISVAVLILFALAYVTERLVRYAESDPISALMGGAHLLKYIEHQMAAKDKTVAIRADDPPQLGGGAKPPGGEP